MQYLRQLKTGHIYPFTPILAKRRDMVPFDEVKAAARIKAMQAVIKGRIPSESVVVSQEEAARKIKAASMELTELENQVDAQAIAEQKAIEDASLPAGKKLNEEAEVTGAEAVEAQRQSILDQDPKYKAVTGYKSRNQVEQYMLLEFGQEIDISLPFKTLKDDAIAKTTDRLLEGY